MLHKCCLSVQKSVTKHKSMRQWRCYDNKMGSNEVTSIWELEKLGSFCAEPCSLKYAKWMCIGLWNFRHMHACRHKLSVYVGIYVCSVLRVCVCRYYTYLPNLAQKISCRKKTKCLLTEQFAEADCNKFEISYTWFIIKACQEHILLIFHRRTPVSLCYYNRLVKFRISKNLPHSATRIFLSYFHTLNTWNFKYMVLLFKWA